MILIHFFWLYYKSIWIGYLFKLPQLDEEQIRTKLDDVLEKWIHWEMYTPLDVARMILVEIRSVEAGPRSLFDKRVDS